MLNAGGGEPPASGLFFGGLQRSCLSANDLLSKDEITTEVTVHARSQDCVANGGGM